MINIIDKEFNFLGQIDEFTSFSATKNWHGVGGFELHVNYKALHADQLQKENIIFMNEEKAFIIMHREIGSNENNLIVRGLELKSYFSRWLIFPPQNEPYFAVNGSAETIMKSYASATIHRKGILNMEVKPNQNRGKITSHQTRYKYLADELQKLSLDSGLGWDIHLDLENNRFIFDVFEGRDLTSGQSDLPNAIFSVEFDNVGEQTLVDSLSDYANTAIIGGFGELEHQIIEVVGDINKGLESFELYVDASDIVFDEFLKDRGEQRLAEHREILSFDSHILIDRNLTYGEDFNLGDDVTIRNKEWNITVDRKLTEVTEIYEAEGYRLDVSFGEGLPTIMDSVKRISDNQARSSGGGSSGTGNIDGGTANTNYGGMDNIIGGDAGGS